MTADLDVLAPRPLICVIDDLHRELTIADAARHGRFSHSGVELDLGRRPDWLNGGLADDVEWRIEWVKLYEGLDLAHAYAMTAEPDYLTAWQDLVESFCDQVEVGHDTADVTARRIQNWLYAWQRVAEAPHYTGLRPGLGRRLVERIIADAQHVRSNLTAQRNHRTLELYALFVVGLAVPEAAPELATFALAELGDNLMTDVWSDGVHRECSTDYHCIVVRSFLGTIANARRAGLELPEGFADRVALAVDFAMHIQRPDGLTPSFSDGDTGDFRGLLELAAGLLDLDYIRWVATGGATGRPPAGLDATFPIGGYLISRSGWGKGTTPYHEERFMLMDAGPIGDGGHGHYDQLSIELHAGGRQFVVDPGRYTYSDSPWRQWFKGSAAHNTVTVDGLDQTPFRPGAPKQPSQARIVCRTSRYDFDAIEADVTSHQHEVVHTRRVLFPGRDYWVVHDHLSGTTNHRYEARWHLPAEADGHATIERSSTQTTVHTPAGVLVVPAHLDVELEAGWVSPTYGVKHAAPVVVVRTNGIRADIVTVLSPGTQDVTLDDLTSDGSLNARISRETTQDLVQWSTGCDPMWARTRSQP